MLRYPRLTAATLGLAAGLVFFTLPSRCRADLLIFELQASPVILSDNGTLTYTAATGNFHSELLPLVYISDSVPGGLAFFTSGMTTIDLFVNPDGSFAANGTGVTVTGSIDFDGDMVDDASGLLLTGAIIDFGAEPAGPPTLVFNGLFEVTGGLFTQNIALSGGGSLYGGFPLGELRGGFFVFAENVTAGTLGDFSQDFSSDSVKATIGVTIPEPSSTLLALTAGAALAGYARYRKRTVRLAG